MSRCKGCGRNIIWVRTVQWKPMPCDPELVKIYAGGNEVFITENGHMTRGNSRGGELIGYGRVPHWATCPEAKSFKRKKEAARHE